MSEKKMKEAEKPQVRPLIGTSTDFSVQARLDADGNVAATVTGIRSYGRVEPRNAVVTCEITDKKVLETIGDVLKEASIDVRDDLDDATHFAASEALTVAAKKGETL